MADQSNDLLVTEFSQKLHGKFSLMFSYTQILHLSSTPLIVSKYILLMKCFLSPKKSNVEKNYAKNTQVEYIRYKMKQNSTTTKYFL